jgi:hypothetical protein
MNRVPQQLQRRLVESFALGRVRVDDRRDVLEARLHLDRHAERRREFRDAGTDGVNAEQHMVIGARDDADEPILAAERQRAAVGPEWKQVGLDRNAGGGCLHV